MKIRPLGAEFFRAETDGQTDTKKLIVAFHDFANALKKYLDALEAVECSLRRRAVRSRP